MYYIGGPLIFIKLISAYGSIAVVSILIFFLSLTHKRGEPYSGWKYSLIEKSCSWCARNVLFMVSVFWIDEVKVDYNYSKYLGPDWKPSKKLPSTIVSNHQSWLDIMVHMYR